MNGIWSIMHRIRTRADDDDADDEDGARKCHATCQTLLLVSHDYDVAPVESTQF